MDESAALDCMSSDELLPSARSPIRRIRNTTFYHKANKKFSQMLYGGCLSHYLSSSCQVMSVLDDR